jgi:hypothetical protein
MRGSNGSGAVCSGAQATSDGLGRAGWNAEARDSVNRPTALVFERNVRADPERREAARPCSAASSRRGVRVQGGPKRRPPGGLETIASVTSQPLQRLLTKAPALGQLHGRDARRGSGVDAASAPRTIAKGAAAIEAWTDGHGTGFAERQLRPVLREPCDGRGHRPPALVRRGPAVGTGSASRAADGRSGDPSSSPAWGRRRAKTGTLGRQYPALSGWVKSARAIGSKFSVLSFGMSKSTASAIEDRSSRSCRISSTDTAPGRV